MIYGILLLAVGIGLLVVTAALARGVHRRWQIPYALLTVGVITYTGALAVQYVALETLGGGLLNILAIRAAAIGLLAGFSEEIARLLGYQYLARGAVTRAQALMIGLGHGMVETIYTGLIGMGLGLSLLGGSAELPEDPAALLSGAVAEAIGGALPLAMHTALSWLVLQVFLRGQIGWLFVAILFHAASESMIVLLGPDAGWAITVWRALIALISVGILAGVRPPVAAESA
mgnify:CR=1 FL=1